MSTRFPRRRGYARVEFLACKPDLQALLEEGHSYRVAYERLSALGRITMTYKHFCDCISGRRSTGARVRRKRAEVMPETRPEAPLEVVACTQTPAVTEPAGDAGDAPLSALVTQPAPPDTLALPAGEDKEGDGIWHPKKFEYPEV